MQTTASDSHRLRSALREVSADKTDSNGEAVGKLEDASAKETEATSGREI